MKKLMVVVAMCAICSCVFAADDLVNCRWENGEKMSRDVCESQRYMHNEDNDEWKKFLKQTKTKEAKAREVRRKAAMEQESKRQKMCASTNRRDLSGLEKAAIVKAVKNDLKDPDSAKFKWMKLAGNGANQEGYVGNYCGLVNAKNSYGGYTGYTPFAAMIGGFGTPRFEVLFITFDHDRVPEECKKECYTDFTLAE